MQMVKNMFVARRSFYFVYSQSLLSNDAITAAPVAEWVRSLYFSALNHSIISPLCLV